jgi:thymidylate synthase (FAD)
MVSDFQSRWPGSMNVKDEATKLDIEVYFAPQAELVGFTFTREPSHFFRAHLIDPHKYEERNDSVEEDLSSGEMLSEFAGRLCYMSFKNPRSGGTPAYIRNIIKEGHGSVLEHVSATFAIWGVSRALTHQLVRHRAGFGYSQLSQRFVDQSANPTIVYPHHDDRYPDEVADTQEFKDYVAFAAQAIKDYQSKTTEKLADIQDSAGSVAYRKQRKQVLQRARLLLPSCAETKIVVTANLRAWRHFLEMRGSEHADEEIRALAISVYRTLSDLYPTVFDDFMENRIGEHEDDITITPTHKKV